VISYNNNIYITIRYETKPLSLQTQHMKRDKNQKATMKYNS